jgi:hypothetical protein
VCLYVVFEKSLESESIDRIISLAVDDLQSFFSHALAILQHLLQHPKIRQEVFGVCNKCLVRNVSFLYYITDIRGEGCRKSIALSKAYVVQIFYFFQKLITT